MLEDSVSFIGHKPEFNPSLQDILDSRYFYMYLDGMD